MLNQLLYESVNILRGGVMNNLHLGEEKTPIPPKGTTERVLAILRQISESRDEISGADIASELGLPRATVYRFLSIFEAEGFIESTSPRKYLPGWELHRISSLVVDNDHFRRFARSVAGDLACDTGETVLVATYLRSEHRAIWAIQQDGPKQLGYSVHVGSKRDLVWGASARVMLAHLDESLIEKILSENQNTRSPVTNEPPPSRETTLREFEEIRNRGYAMSFGQIVPHVVNIAAPIFDGQGDVTASISLSIPDLWFKPDTEHRLAPLVIEAANKLSSLLGFRE